MGKLTAMRYGIGAVLMIGLLAGCQSGPANEVYHIAVTNQTDQPLTVGLAYPQGDYEGWATPEQIAIARPDLMDRKWGLEVLPPDKGVVLVGIKGPPEGAWLRVYEGNKTITQLMAVGARSADRLDLPLRPGKNRYVITNPKVRLEAQRADWPGALPDPAKFGVER